MFLSLLMLMHVDEEIDSDEVEASDGVDNAANSNDADSEDF